MKSICVLLLLFGTNSLIGQEKFELHFDFNAAIPNATSAENLSDWLANNGAVKVIRIEGFCDHVDSDAYNKDLSIRRANAVLGILQSTNVDVENATILGFGENFKQSAIQSDNRKVIVYYETPKNETLVQPPPSTQLTNQIAASKAGEKFKLENLHFYDMSDVVVPKSKPILSELLEIMKTHPTLEIEIQGHICCMTVDKYQTAKLRALRVYNYLVDSGIDKSRLSYKSLGSSKPVYPLPEKTEAEKDANRRVEIMVIRK